MHTMAYAKIKLWTIALMYIIVNIITFNDSYGENYESSNKFADTG